MDSDPSLVPRIEVETTELHVGTIPNAGLFETRLAVYNRGKAPLRLSDVRTNCACSQGRIPESSRVVPPGGEGVIEVMVDPRRIVGFHSRKTLTLFSNDPEQSRVRIDVVADVDPEFEVIPAEVEFGEVEKGEVVSRTVLVRQRQEEPLEITDVAERGRRAGD
ncbi:MAG TPA: DUF1573 domain-containing protein, partial [Candidatus Hydrogenedentes bacterium]|nr:DUF1573 domain-containing protein [Candidatus Hydrogenedentota bacterium]